MKVNRAAAGLGNRIHRGTMSTEEILEVVKGLILITDCDTAVKYISKNREILFSKEARKILLAHIAAQDGDFKAHIESMLKLLDECKLFASTGGKN